MINVIGGKYRSRVLLTPPSSTTLPTKNMVRGAIFSALGNLNGAIVLDLFAGSGALGIEALSRGAKEAIFVELDKVAAKVVKDNLDKLKEENGRVLQMEALEALKLLAKEKRQFDLLLLDPPYANKEIYQRAIDFALENDMLTKEAKIIVEYEGELPLNTSSFPSRRDYKYGYTKVIYLRKE